MWWIFFGAWIPHNGQVLKRLPPFRKIERSGSPLQRERRCFREGVGAELPVPAFRIRDADLDGEANEGSNSGLRGLLL